MNKNLMFSVMSMLLALASTVSLSAKGVSKVVGVEVGYGYLTSTKNLSPENPHGLLTSLYYGYAIGDKPSSLSVLSLALGYDWFPMAAGAADLHSLVYGLEYAHTFFRRSRVALLVDYGLLFNLILQSGRDGYAFGHHTRLGLGPVFSLGGRHKLALNAAYNFVTFPYFELSSSRMSFPSLSLRYLLAF